MSEKSKARRKPALQDYLERLDFGRKIHQKVDDGALLALCEDYGGDKEPDRKGS